MNFGLSETDLKYIHEQLKKNSEIEKAFIFGSRAKGNYKPGSDVDLAIFGNNITLDTVLHLQSLLEDEGYLPYHVDVVDYCHLKNEALKEHIDRIGVLIYERENTCE